MHASRFRAFGSKLILLTPFTCPFNRSTNSFVCKTKDILWSQWLARKPSSSQECRSLGIWNSDVKLWISIICRFPTEQNLRVNQRHITTTDNSFKTHKTAWQWTRRKHRSTPTSIMPKGLSLCCMVQLDTEKHYISYNCHLISCQTLTIHLFQGIMCKYVAGPSIPNVGVTNG